MPGILRLMRKKKYIPLVSGSYNSILDPYWANVVLAMHMEGSNSYPTLIDETGRHTLTRFGSSALTNSISKFGTSSLGGFGYSSGVSCPASSDFNLGDGCDWTAEGWVYLTVQPSANGAHFMGTADPWYGRYGWGIELTNNAIEVVGNGCATGCTIATVSWTLNAWHHIAVCKKGAAVYVFVDGIQQPTNGVTSVFSNISTETFWIGDYNSTSQNSNDPSLYFPGYIDEVRITKGVARYTGNFTVPSTPIGDLNSTDYFWDNTVLLTHFDGDYVDSKGNNGQSTRGTPVFSSVTPFGSGKSISFGGNSCTRYGYATTPLRLDENFTVEGWVRFNNIPTGIQHIITLINNDTPDSNTCYFYTYNRNGNMSFELNFAGTIANPNIQIQSGKWYHFAISKYVGVVGGGNGALALHIDGIPKVNIVFNPITAALNQVSIGGSYAAQNYYLDGQVDDIRITKDVCRHSGNNNFTIPNKPYSDLIISGDTYSSNVVLGMHMEDLTDVKGSSVTNQGNVSIVPNGKFGSCASFDGASYLSLQAAPKFNLGTNDFAIEFWINTTQPQSSFATRLLVLGQYNVSGTIQLNINQNPRAIRVDAGVSTIIQGSKVLTDGVWHHIAVTRYAGQIRAFIDGIQDGVTASNNTNFSTDSGVCIGTDLYLGSAAAYVGLLDDLRITSGYARYTSNFPVPTSSFATNVFMVTGDLAYDPYWQQTVLLMHMENNVTDQKGNVVTNTGVTFSNTVFKQGSYSANFAGANSALTMSALGLKSIDFTFECYINLKAYPTTPVSVIAASYISGMSGGFMVSITPQGKFGASNTYTPVYGTTTLALNTWYHVAVTYQASTSTISVFVNGVKEASTAGLTINTEYKFFVGGVPGDGTAGGWWYNGYIDELRITKGVIRYPGSFIPPTYQLQDK